MIERAGVTGKTRVVGSGTVAHGLARLGHADLAVCHFEVPRRHRGPKSHAPKALDYNPVA